MNDRILPIVYQSISSFLIFTLFSILLVTKVAASTWIDPFFDEGIARAKLIAMGRLKNIDDDKKIFEISRVLKGSVSPGSSVIVWDVEAHGHGHGDEEGAIGKEFLLIVTSYKDTFSAFSPSFGLFPVFNDTLFAPIKDPLVRVPVERNFLMNYISLQLKDDARLRDSMVEQGVKFLTTANIHSRKEIEICNQVLYLEVLAHFGEQKHTALAAKFLMSGYNHVRWAAVDALGYMGGRQADNILIKHLESEESRDVLSILGKMLYKNRPEAARGALREIIPRTSGQPVALSNSIMNPIFNDLPAERHSLAAALMRLDGYNEPYDSLVLLAPEWLRTKSGLTIDDLEELKTIFSFENAFKGPDTVYRLFVDDSMKHLPADIVTLKNLRELSLAIPDLEELPVSLAELKNLEVLSITKGKLKQMPKVIFELPNLQKLFFRVEIDSLPSGIAKLKKLRALSLGRVGYHILPETICELTELRELNLRMSDIDSLPMCIGSLPNLRTIEIYGNNMTTFPAALLNSASLQIVEIGSNYIKRLPPDMSRMKKLKFVDLSYNPLSLKERKRIDTSYKGINIDIEVAKGRFFSVEEAISDAENAESVHDENNVTGMDAHSYEKLTRTKYLILSKNNLQRVPDGILTLSQLETLNLSDNNISELPADIGNMRGLHSLYLSGNPIKALPPEMKNLTLLRDLYLYNCDLTEIPEWVKDLPNLQYLSLSKNQLSEKQKEQVRGWFKDRKITLWVD